MSGYTYPTAPFAISTSQITTVTTPFVDTAAIEDETGEVDVVSTPASSQWSVFPEAPASNTVFIQGTVVGGSTITITYTGLSGEEVTLTGVVFETSPNYYLVALNGVIGGGFLTGGEYIQISNAANDARTSVTYGPQNDAAPVSGYNEDTTPFNGDTASAPLSPALQSGAVVTIGPDNLLPDGTPVSGGTVLAGATLIVDAGAVASAIQSYGTIIVEAGGEDSGVIVHSGGNELLNGGLASGTTLESGGTETVQGGGSFVFFTVSSGGSLDLAPGSVLSNGIIASGATLIVSSGVTAAALTIEPGGLEIVEAGGSVVLNTVSGTAILESGGTDSAGVVASDGTETVQSGGTLMNVTISDGGTAFVEAGGIVLQGDTQLPSGGLVLGSGSLLSQGVLNTGELLAVSNGVAVIGVNIEGGASLGVDSGATAESNVFGAVIVESGGTTINDNISSGGQEDAASGALLLQTQIWSGGTLNLESGSLLSQGVVNSGATLVVSNGAWVSGDTVALGGMQIVVSGGTAESNVSGIDIVENGGTDSGSFVDSGGTETVQNGGIAIFATAEAGGTLAVQSGGDLISAALSSGGSFDLVAGSTVNGGFVWSGGTLVVSDGVTVTSMVIASGGTEIVESGGTTKNTVGGAAIVMSGGTDSGGFVDSGGTETVQKGGTGMNVTVVAGGTEIVQSGDTTQNNIDSGTAIVSGTDTDGMIESGGTEEVASGGAIVGGDLEGGTLVILSGGSADLASRLNNGAIVFSGSGPEQLTIDGNLAPAAAISGFTDPAVGGNTIDITGIGSAVTSTSFTFNSGAETLNVSGMLGLTTVDFTAGSTPGPLELTTDGNGGILVICFAEGTRIATTRGDVAVETLREDASVLTAAGDVAGVKWIGHRRFNLAARPDVAPIRFGAGSLGEGVPSRDLLVSPEHAMGLDGKLVPARLLVNGSTITRDTSMAAITYYHVELPHHDLLLAEGAAAESWLDTGNRGMFANAPGAVDLHADLEPDLASEAWQTQACAPLVEGGPDLAAIRARLEGRAITLGHGAAAAWTLWLETEGKHSVVLAVGGGLVRLASVAARAPGDQRRLGAVLAGVAVDGVALDLEDHRLALGFYAVERRGDTCWRWTDGQALLDFGPSEVERVVTVTVTVIAAEQDWAVAA
jgi:autotransporter passenger strand-loop-strand repeat protein